MGGSNCLCTNSSERAGCGDGAGFESESSKQSEEIGGEEEREGALESDTSERREEIGDEGEAEGESFCEGGTKNATWSFSRLWEKGSGSMVERDEGIG